MLPKEVKSMSKQRKMTEKEKKERAKIRKQLREDGLLPPKKKPMNRKKFIDEARSVYESMDILDNLPYLVWGISEMLAHTTDLKPDLQAVGVAKVILLAQRRREFEQAKRAQGESTWRAGELVDAVMDIYKA